MRLVYKFYIPHTSELDEMMQIANNLYNQALYEFQKRWKEDGHSMWFNEMDKYMKTVLNAEGKCNYKLLKSCTAQAVLYELNKNVSQYVRRIQKHKEDPKVGIGSMPRYKKKGGMMPVCFTYVSTSLYDGYLHLRRDIKVKVPQWDKYYEDIKNFKRIRLFPEYSRIKVEIFYDKDVPEASEDKSNVAAIDIGIDNLVTLVTKQGCYIYSGRFLKAYNKQYNNKLLQLLSIKDKCRQKKGYTKQMMKLLCDRNNYIDDVFNKYSRMIVDKLIEEQVTMLIVGYNEGWKTGKLKMAKQSKKDFRGIPHSRLLDKLEYKCKMAGIWFKKQEEGYTSKCDALALEPIGKHDKYLGKRVQRGLFQSSVGKRINADQNGALNILRKAVGDSGFSQIIGRGHSLCPVRYINPFE